MTTYSQKMPRLLQEADNEIMTNGCFFPPMGLAATQFLMNLDYMYINVYLKNTQGNPSILKETDHLTGADAAYKVTTAKTVS